MGERSPMVERFRVGDLLVDLAAEVVRRADREVPLHPLTFDLLAELVRRHPGTTPHEALMDALWPGVFVGEENLKQRVRLLRRALGDEAADPTYVGTVRGRGYRLVAPVEPLPVRAETPGRDPSRVAVAVFANRTGRDVLDELGPIAADWIAGGLVRVPGARVVPSSTSLLLHRRHGGEDAPEEAVARLVHESLAGTVITGTFYLRDRALVCQAQILATERGWGLCRAEEVEATLEEPLDGIDRIRERILVAVAERLDPRVPLAGWENRPPTYESYRRYVEGLERFVRMDFPGALEPLAASARADPSFAAPRLIAAIARLNLGEPGRAEELVATLEPERHRLSPLDRTVLDEVAALCRGDHAAALDRARRAAELAPASPWAFEAARVAVLDNLPREAVATLRRLDPDRGPFRGWEPYWFYLALALHVLGDYGAELEAAEEAKVRHPTSLWPHAFELRARIARGEEDAAGELLDNAVTLRAHGTLTVGGLLALASREILAHGRRELSREVAERGLAWYGDRPPSEREERPHRLEVARLALLADRLQEAEASFRSLAAEAPEDPEVIGSLGLLAARRGDPEAAAEAAERLRALDRPYLFGSAEFWRGVIAAWSGRPKEAVTLLLAEAVAEGYPFGWPGLHPHEDPALAPLRDDPGFRAWLTSRG